MLKKKHYLKYSRDGFELHEKVESVFQSTFTRLICTLDYDDLSTILSNYQRLAARKCNHTWQPTNLKICDRCGHTEIVERIVPRIKNGKKM